MSFSVVEVVVGGTVKIGVVMRTQSFSSNSCCKKPEGGVMQGEENSFSEMCCDSESDDDDGCGNMRTLFIF